MKKSSLMHGTAYVTGWLSIFALIGAWVAGEDGTALGFSGQHLYNDTIALALITIAALLCATLYWHQEQKS